MEVGLVLEDGLGKVQQFLDVLDLLHVLQLAFNRNSNPNGNHPGIAPKFNMVLINKRFIVVKHEKVT